MPMRLDHDLRLVLVVVAAALGAVLAWQVSSLAHERAKLPGADRPCASGIAPRPASTQAMVKTPPLDPATNSAITLRDIVHAELRARVDYRYAPFFQGLTENVDRLALRRLLAERTQGILEGGVFVGPDAGQDARAEFEAEFQRRLKRLLPAGDYDRFVRAELALPYRNLALLLRNRLAAEGGTLTPGVESALHRLGTAAAHQPQIAAREDTATLMGDAIAELDAGQLQQLQPQLSPAETRVLAAIREWQALERFVATRLAPELQRN